MSKNIPTSSTLSLMGLLVNLIIISFLCYLFHQWSPDYFFIFAALSYSLLARTLRSTVARQHRIGVRLMRQQRFAVAIPHLEASLSFFSSHPWIDRLRGLTLLSSSGSTYLEMALCNIGFCYSQMGEGERAFEVYQRVLMKYPKNGIALVAVRMLTAMQAPKGPIDEAG